SQIPPKVGMTRISFCIRKFVFLFAANRQAGSLITQTLKKFIQIILVIFFLAPVFSCRKDRIITDSSAKLEFSSDSVLFDTVFTTIGSATRLFTIHNRNNGAVKISSVKFGSGTSTQFLVNIDGVPVKSTANITIPGKDSLFVFVQVNVNPANQNSPLIIRDSIIFVTNGNIQSVYLEAWGQDAYYTKPNIFFTNGFSYSIISCNSTWTNDKPHVIYGYAVVDSACTLTILPGTRVYLHKNAVLWVLNDGTLDIQGSQSNPVTFQGDRLEPEYKDIPGQWGKIWLSSLSKNNKINWAILKNGAIGIQADTVNLASGNPTLRISNTIINNMSAAAIYGQGAHINGYNCVFGNCGQYTAALTIGGKYSFKHCTFSNYWSGFKATRTTPALLINNWYKAASGAVQSRSIDSAYFGNCIIYGNLANEIGIDSSAGGNFRYKFENCVIKADGSYNALNTYHNSSVKKNTDPGFKDAANNNCNISLTSPAKDWGNSVIGNMYPVDLNGNPRNVDTAPDAGAYEYKP
ncbi:MAG: hypothetical protein JNL63_00620, partial [Bacteroidia bacterium]|nr:hypothetical protein [Bacteroidia bacterium]